MGYVEGKIEDGCISKSYDGITYFINDMPREGMVLAIIIWYDRLDITTTVYALGIEFKA